MLSAISKGRRQTAFPTSGLLADESRIKRRNSMAGEKSVDRATLEILAKAKADGVSTVFDRAEEMRPCPIGAEGSCCKNCAMGPCRVPAPKKKGETEVDRAKRRGSVEPRPRPSRRAILRAWWRQEPPLIPITPGAWPNLFWERPKGKFRDSRSKTNRSSIRWPWIWS